MKKRRKTGFESFAQTFLIITTVIFVFGIIMLSLLNLLITAQFKSYKMKSIQLNQILIAYKCKNKNLFHLIELPK